MDISDKLWDMAVAVKLEHENEFLEMLGKKTEIGRRYLEDINNGPFKEEDDACCPFPPLTFENKGYKIYVRRNKECEKIFSEIMDIATEINQKYGDDCLIGTCICEETVGQSILTISEIKDFSDFFDLAIKYKFNCESAENYSSVAQDPAYTRLESYDKNETGFVALALSMDKGAADRVREILPDTLNEYLEKMCCIHCVIQNADDSEFDGNEIYIIVNLPIRGEIGFDSEEIEAGEGYIGQEFVNFFQENTDDILESGNFVAFMAPQPGIIKNLNWESVSHTWYPGENWENFATPWGDITPFVWDGEDVAFFWGEQTYYEYQPFHLRLFRYICLLEADKQKSLDNKPNNSDKAAPLETNEPDNAKAGGKNAQEAMKATLKNTALAIFEQMKNFPSPHGFHFSYSPESSWNGDADFLILTINPSASDGHGKAKKIVPKYPWPKKNDFFDPNNSFAIKKPVQGICYELSRIVNFDEAEEPLVAAERFANEKAIIASFVPFRTKDAGKIEDSMLAFARDEYWGKIFASWQPKAIVTLGNPPFNAMREFLDGKYEEMEYKEEKVSENGNLVYRMAGFRMPDGDTITLIGLPHPTAFGEKGFPTNFPENATSNCRLREFLEKNLIPGVRYHDLNNGEELSEKTVEVGIGTTGTDHQNGLLVDPREAIQEDCIICCICGEKRSSITAKHLSTHGLSTEDYKKLCGYSPDQALMGLNRLK